MRLLLPFFCAAFCVFACEHNRAPTAPTASGRQVIELTVTADGFVPADVKVRKDQPVTLHITRLTDQTCATEVLISGTDINVPLPLNQPVDIAYTPTKTGTVKYGCAMNMMVSGVLTVE